MQTSPPRQKFHLIKTTNIFTFFSRLDLRFCQNASPCIQRNSSVRSKLDCASRSCLAWLFCIQSVGFFSHPVSLGTTSTPGTLHTTELRTRPEAHTFPELRTSSQIRTLQAFRTYLTIVSIREVGYAWVDPNHVMCELTELHSGKEVWKLQSRQFWAGAKRALEDVCLRNVVIFYQVATRLSPLLPLDHSCCTAGQ